MAFFDLRPNQFPGHANRNRLMNSEGVSRDNNPMAKHNLNFTRPPCFNIWSYAYCMLACLSSPVTLHAQQAPHPWIADAPGEIVRLIGLGNVRLEIDDQAVKASNKLALTAFQLKVTFDARIRYDWISQGNQNQPWKARIIANVPKPRIYLEHQVIIPSTFQPMDPWESALMKHEFDHVAISTDPRLLTIMERIFKRKWVFTEEWDQPSRPTDADVQSRVEQLLAGEVKNCEKLIQQQYDWLDLQSVSGSQSLESRMSFFQELYSFPGLERCSFARRDLVKEHLNRISPSESLIELERHYLSLR